jgi:hypothetical protein
MAFAAFARPDSGIKFFAEFLERRGLLRAQICSAEYKTEDKDSDGNALHAVTSGPSLRVNQTLVVS